jgi:RimJ/RimL family protein N-acetyltransferase
MRRQPTLETARLRLRPFRMADAEGVQRLAGDRAVADTTLNIPHPYEDGFAERWIGNHRDWFGRGQQAIFAVILKASPAAANERPRLSAAKLIGAVALLIQREDERAELGYWIGRPYWNQGYGTEAARAVIGFGFQQLGLNRIYAHHFVRNPASGRVLQKLGMSHEGRLRQHVRKWDAFEDLELYAVLKERWRPMAEGDVPSILYHGCQPQGGDLR